LNGEPNGLTPLLLTGLAWGRYEVAVARSGHEPSTQVVELSEGTPTAAVKVSLKPMAATPAAPKDVYVEQEVDLPPTQVSGNPVAFPANLATTPGKSLSVGVTFMVTEDGDVTQIKIVESGGLPLDEAVLRALATWKFAPATKGGAKVKTLLRRKFTFKT
jgi:TonB family protein